MTNGEKTAGGDHTEHKRRLPIISDASDGPDNYADGYWY